MISEFGGHWGRAFWNFQRQVGRGGGVKMFMLPMVEYGYFLESPSLGHLFSRIAHRPIMGL